MRTRTVTAIPCGTRNGTPITRAYRYDLSRDPEPFGKDAATGRTKSRLWGPCRPSTRHALNRQAPLAVVWTDTIHTLSPTQQEPR